MQIDLSPNDKSKLLTKVEREFSRADVHTKTWKGSVENVGRDYLLEQPEQDKIKYHMVWEELKARKSIFLGDEIQVTNVPMDGKLGARVANNADKVLEYNFDSMNIRQKYEEVLEDDAMQGVGVLAVDGWNDHDQEPILSYIDSRLTFPDPSNWRGSNMQFFGTLLRKSLFELEADDAYDNEAVQKIIHEKSEEITKIQRANDQVKGFTSVLEDDETVDIYNHITIFKEERDDNYHKYLTTWSADRSTLLRVVKMGALTATERADPSKITLGVTLFRSNPIKGSYAGASIIDEKGQFQNLLSLMINLKTSQAIEAGLGGKLLIDSDLGVDLDDLALAGPAAIPFTSNNPAKNATNSISYEPSRPNNPAIQEGIAMIEGMAQTATSTGNNLVQGQSQGGNQTKAEVQTLQQNLNQDISRMQSNLMEGLKEMYEIIMRYYILYMSPQRKKTIVRVTSSGQSDAYGFKKSEFVPKGEVYIKIKSKAQEDIKKKQSFAVMTTVYSLVAQTLAPGSAEANAWNRKYIDESGIHGIKGEDFVPLSADERRAYSNLEMLNYDIPLKSKPKPGQDHNGMLKIYYTGIKTPARDKAIADLELILTQAPKQAPQPTDQGGVGAQLGASMLATDNAKGATPSVGDVAA